MSTTLIVVPLLACWLLLGFIVASCIGGSIALDDGEDSQ
jgi:hypothetical protein